MKFVFHGKTINGKPKISRRSELDEVLQSFEGKDFTLTIEKKKKSRSNEQNRYLHALFTIFRNELNALGNRFTMEQVKELCKAKFATVDMVNEATGEIIGQRIKGTSEMTTTELNEFIENIIEWAATMFHIVLPYPNENFVLEFK